MKKDIMILYIYYWIYIYIHTIRLYIDLVYETDEYSHSYPIPSFEKI